VKTVEAHKFNLMRKLDIHGKARLVQYAIQKKIIKFERTGLRLAARLRLSQQIATRVTADTRHLSGISHLFRNLASGPLTAF
jgi:hypothetical protein